MAVTSKHKPENRWDQTGFEKLKATWWRWRVAKNEKRLRQVFALAADSVVVAEALDWAQQHGIKFFIDRQANLGGYYTMGTGVVALTPSVFQNLPRMAEVLVHETRHAWQDYNGLLSWDDDTPRQGNFNDFYINMALIEADARAFGKLAAAQVEISQLEKSDGSNWALPRLKKAVADESAKLGKEFLNWFDKQWRPAYYGDAASKAYGKKWGLYKGALPELKTEFNIKPSTVMGMDIHDRQDILRLGVDFSGTKNYLAALQPDILPKRILRPSLADTFWGAANDKQIKLTTELRKAHLKQKLKPENRKPRHPWP